MSRGPARQEARRIRLGYGTVEGIRVAYHSARSNMVRSGLTILGIAIGVGVVVIMAALITGIRGSIQDEIEATGPRNFFVMRIDLTDIQLVQDGSRPSWWDRPSIRAEEARRAGDLPAIRSATLSFGLQDPGADGDITLESRGTRVTGVQGFGESAQWPEHRAVTFTEGRNFVTAEVEEARAVVVVTGPLARDLFGDRSAVGQRILASMGGNAVPLTVVGVVEIRPALFEEEVSQRIVVPHTTAVRRMGASAEWGQMIVVPRSEVAIDVAEDQIIALLRTMRGLEPGVPNDFTVLRSTQLLELFDEFTGVFFIVMLTLSSAGLLVGGVGVVGIMLISVTERTREIGIRKATGATRNEILWQFLVEAGALTLLGAAMGLSFGGGTVLTVAAMTPIPASVPAWAVAAALGMAGLTGMLFGLIPAVRAARMEPVRALRYE